MKWQHPEIHQNPPGGSDATMRYYEQGAWPGLGSLPTQYKALQTTPLLKGTQPHSPTIGPPSLFQPWASHPLEPLATQPQSPQSFQTQEGISASGAGGRVLPAIAWVT